MRGRAKSGLARAPFNCSVVPPEYLSSVVRNKRVNLLPESTQVSRAKRTPENCQQAAAGKKLR